MHKDVASVRRESRVRQVIITLTRTTDLTVIQSNSARMESSARLSREVKVSLAQFNFGARVKLIFDWSAGIRMSGLICISKTWKFLSLFSATSENAELIDACFAQPYWFSSLIWQGTLITCHNMLTTSAEIDGNQTSFYPVGLQSENVPSNSLPKLIRLRRAARIWFKAKDDRAGSGWASSGTIK